MSVQFGKCNFDGKPVDPTDLDRVRPMLTPFGPDGEGHICRGNIGILYGAFHTTRESRREVQPHRSVSGAVITWDGRLDNREELIGQLGGDLSASSTDVTIVTAAYERWGKSCFAKLVGDWALAVWEPASQSVILVKDFIGARHLYYSSEKDQVTWCSILDPLLRLAGQSFELEEEYVAGWLSSFPATYLTPYRGVHSVPPSSFVQLSKGTRKVVRYWTFDPSKRVHHRADGDYEEEFRALFAQSVQRRLRSESPVLAELSGGIDSSSIVCMADEILARGRGDTPRLDTISYYDDSEPNWNERPFFTRVEEKRGRVGCHIDASAQEGLDSGFETGRLVPTPAHRSRLSNVAAQTAACMNTGGSRIVLSGVGGDEFMGGVPTPIPELADLLLSGRTGDLAHQLKLWALAKRKPWFQLLSQTASRFLPVCLARDADWMRSLAWLNPAFVRRHRMALQGYPSRIRVFGGPPSFQEAVSTVEVLRRQLACHTLAPEMPNEQRYPFLDRDLLEFVFAIPREQLVRPGHRRSLMRRALQGIVPDNILNRKRKAYVTRSASLWILQQAAAVGDVEQFMICECLNLVDGQLFSDALKNVREGKEVPVVPIMRALTLECWLKSLARYGKIAHAPVVFSKSELKELERAPSEISAS